MTASDDDRFDELIHREFGHRTQRPQHPEDLFQWTDPDPAPEPEPEYTLDHVELDDEDYFPSEERPPADPITPSRWPLPSRIGAALLLAAVALTGAVILPLPLPGWVSWLIPVAFLGGIVLLLSQLPRHRPEDDDGVHL